jgi:small subunit ribosomal protein S2
MRVAAQGSLILFVGTKRQASASIQELATEVNMPFCTERWLGGTLTNFRTVRSRLKRLEELEAMQESGEIRTYSKKMQSTLMREYRKIYRNLNGIRDMNRLPECLVVVDPGKEKNAVHEARLLGIKVVSLIDTDSDPDTVDLVIPGNDDSLRSIRLIIQHLTERRAQSCPVNRLIANSGSIAHLSRTVGVFLEAPTVTTTVVVSIPKAPIHRRFRGIDSSP